MTITTHSNTHSIMTCLQSGWPETVVRVQSLAEAGITAIPERYIKPVNDRPILINHNHYDDNNNIPVIDLQQVYSNNKVLREETLTRVSDSCRDWGFFQVVNHGVSHELMSRTREVWREFFNLPLEMKQELANDPSTYEGYGSRVGVEKGAILDWSDYFFLNYLPLHLRNPNKWPTLPTSCRDLVAEYGNEVVKLCERLMKILSVDLGLGEDQLQNAFGGENIGATMRVNFYPKCPQPDLALGLSSHSDPGGLTLLLPDENVAGLQVRQANGSWVTVKPVPNAFIVNIGDQIQVLSNTIYKSVEHRVLANSTKERVSLAFFYNPKSDIPIEPIKDLVTEDRPALYQSMTYDQYRLYIRIKGPSGKKQVESLKSST